MRLYHPKSILRLMLIGFSLVTLPLIIGLVFATISVDRLVSKSQHALLQSVLATQNSQVLVEAITAMERNARQYQVLGDKVLFDVYEENHQKFVDTARTLDVLDITSSQRKPLKKLYSAESQVHGTLSSHPHDAPQFSETLPRFTELAQMAQEILGNNRNLVIKGVEDIKRNAGKVQQTLALQAIALVPTALLIALLFALLITRLIKQIDHAIRMLGDEKLNEPVVVIGPRDLEQIGERLNWLRNRLLELEQEKAKFLQHISHELKTPLTAIRESAELMNEQVVGKLNEQQQEIVGILHESSLQLQKLIEDLLNFSILRSRASQLTLEPVEMKTLIEEVLEKHKLTLLSRKLDLRVSLQPVNLAGDPAKLGIMVDNLVSNAIKYSPDGSPLWILLRRRGDSAIIEVADSGPGIPESQREKVFEAFFQGMPASRSHIRGTGLGLSIAREYAQAHSGNITVVDSSKIGARLRVIIPLKQGYQAS